MAFNLSNNTAPLSVKQPAKKLYEAASISVNCLESIIRRQNALLFFEIKGASANKVSLTATVLMVIGSFTSAGSKSEMETTARLGDDKGNIDVVGISSSSSTLTPKPGTAVAKNVSDSMVCTFGLIEIFLLTLDDGGEREELMVVPFMANDVLVKQTKQ